MIYDFVKLLEIRPTGQPDILSQIKWIVILRSFLISLPVVNVQGILSFSLTDKNNVESLIDLYKNNGAVSCVGINFLLNRSLFL